MSAGNVWVALKQSLGRQAGNVKPAHQKQQEQGEGTRRAEGKPAAEERGHGRKHAGKHKRHGHRHQDHPQQVKGGNHCKYCQDHLRRGRVLSLSIQGDPPGELTSRPLSAWR